MGFRTGESECGMLNTVSAPAAQLPRAGPKRIRREKTRSLIRDMIRWRSIDDIVANLIGHHPDVRFPKNLARMIERELLLARLQELGLSPGAVAFELENLAAAARRATRRVYL
jgi:hypothetical protein